VLGEKQLHPNVIVGYQVKLLPEVTVDGDSQKRVREMVQRRQSSLAITEKITIIYHNSYQLSQMIGSHIDKKLNK